ncbi:hypothetical protein ABTY96_42785 [Streptomyces sp. NPDC096057]|uniref:hypothetical protein n=1 Tax=Streptomyces sp. NPDC096057 TaxID=3155543 RepID=UPI00331C0F5F
MPEEPLPENPAAPDPRRAGPAARASHSFGDRAHIHHGGGNYNFAYAVVAGSALLPFLQALGTAVGTRVGERLDDATRGALRRILRRELEQRAPRGSSPAPRVLSSPGGTRIRLDPDMPEEALAQLLTLVFERLEAGDPDAPALVRWTPTGWLATVARAGQLYDLSWDSQRSQWVESPAPPNPYGDAG